jgi:hypothetical protein
MWSEMSDSYEKLCQYCGHKSRQPASTDFGDQCVFYFYLSIYFVVINVCWFFFNHQLDAQTSRLFTYNTFIKILYMFRAYRAHLQEVYAVIVYVRSLVSSLSAGDCPVHWLRKKEFFLSRYTGQSPAESDDTRDRAYTITA